jgi:hypothetical protein
MALAPLASLFYFTLYLVLAPPPKSKPHTFRSPSLYNKLSKGSKKRKLDFLQCIIKKSKLTMAGGVGMVKRTSVDALAVFHVCVYICAEIDLVHHSLTPVQKGERKGEAKHLIPSPQPHLTLAPPRCPILLCSSL